MRCLPAPGLPLPQVERLQRKFAMIHSTLAQQQTAKPEPDTPKLRASEENPLNMSLRSSLPGGLKVGRGGGQSAIRGCACRDGGWLLALWPSCRHVLLPMGCDKPGTESMRSQLPLQASQDLSKKMAGLDVAKNGGAPRAVLASMR